MIFGNPKPITLKTLIAHLQTLPQEAFVAFCLHSEQRLMQLDDISVQQAQAPRPDGWVHGEWGSDSKHLQTQQYILFPGN